MNKTWENKNVVSCKSGDLLLTRGMNEFGTENRPAYIGFGHEMAH